MSEKIVLYRIGTSEPAVKFEVIDMVKMLELLKWQGYERASLAVQKENYAVKMYKNVGFKTVDENAEEYIMVCEL